MTTGTITALYARFSYDDGIDAESGSIEHQKQLLSSYAENNGFADIRYYSDDGYTGTNFDRPDFRRMMEDIKRGLVKTVIIKDMSRFGRNYLMVGQYTEIEFKKYGVRLIAINDNVDTANGTNDLLPINNLMNEWYSKDISKKVRAMIQHKGKSGEPTTSVVPYGYYRSPDDKTAWLINEEEAEAVRLIFDLYLNHNYNMTDIARVLKERKVVRPKYRNALSKGKTVDAEDLYSWDVCGVKSVLRRQEYVGDTVNFRTERRSYKEKKKIFRSSDKHLIFPDTHPAIISREDFQRVQDKYEKNFRHKGEDHYYLLADQVYCMDCHARMHGKKVATIGKTKRNSYECSTYRKGNGCFFHGVPEDYLMGVVLKTIQEVLTYAKTDYDAFSKQIQRILDENTDGTKAVMQSELEKAQKRNAEIDKYIQGLFEAKVKGEIEGTLFANLKKIYDEEKNQLSKVIIDLIEKLNNKNENSDKVKILFRAIRKYDAVTELTPEVLVDFIDRIEVGKFRTQFKGTGNRNIPLDKRDNLVSVYFWGVGIINFDEKFVP